MASWRFYQGLRAEWRWYKLDAAGNVIADSDRGFAELRGCMENAETVGFQGRAFQVHARQAGSFTESQLAANDAGEAFVATEAIPESPDEQAAP